MLSSSLAQARQTARLFCVLAVFSAVLVLVRNGIVLLNKHSIFMQHYSDVIREQKIEPASLFYTENPLALAAEKKVAAGIESRLQ